MKRTGVALALVDATSCKAWLFLPTQTAREASRDERLQHDARYAGVVPARLDPILPAEPWVLGGETEAHGALCRRLPGRIPREAIGLAHGCGRQSAP